MTSTRNSRIEIDSKQWSGFFDELRSESDRGGTILAGVWIDNLLERKLRALFTEGNSDTRRKLFDLNGPFSGFSSKILAAYSLGWIDSDIFHDINVVRKIRNLFAHELHGIDLESQRLQRLIEKFKIPSRYYHDWNELRAVATEDGTGAILYTGEQPSDAGNALDIQRFRYRWIISLLVAEVAASLDCVILIQESKNEIDPDRTSDLDK